MSARSAETRNLSASPRTMPGKDLSRFNFSSVSGLNRSDIQGSASRKPGGGPWMHQYCPRPLGPKRSFQNSSHEKKSGESISVFCSTPARFAAISGLRERTRKMQRLNIVSGPVPNRSGDQSLAAVRVRRSSQAVPERSSDNEAPVPYAPSPVAMNHLCRAALWPVHIATGPSKQLVI